MGTHFINVTSKQHQDQHVRVLVEGSEMHLVQQTQVVHWVQAVKPEAVKR